MKAIIYSRVSTGAQEGDGTSLDTQERACDELAADRGWRVVRRIREAASGGVLERDGLDELRAALRRGEVEVVVAFAVDRLSRSQNHIGVLFDEFERAGAQLELVTERFEDTAVGRFILAARAFIAEVEREKIAERTMRGKQERARSGRIPQATGRGMYGYHYDPTVGRRVVNDEQAAVVRRVFEDFAGGASILGITNALNEAGTLSFTGRAWSAWTVKNMLRNPGYAERTIFKRTKTGHRRDPLTGKRRRTVALRDESGGSRSPMQRRRSSPRSCSTRSRPGFWTRSANARLNARTTTPLEASCAAAAVTGRWWARRRWASTVTIAAAAPRHDRCPTRYIRAGDLEDAVTRELTTVLSAPEVVLAEIEHATSGAVTVQRTDEGPSGALAGVIPHRFARFEGDFSHH